MRRLFVVLTLALACVGLPPRATQAGGGPFGTDHVVAYDNSGIWARLDQLAFEYGEIDTVIGGAVLPGDDAKLVGFVHHFKP